MKQKLLNILYRFAGVIILIVLCALCQLLSSCRTVKYVPVVETHTEYIHQTDTFKLTDTVINNTTTLIKEVDSTEMARLGIILKNKEKAWLVERNELLREVSNAQNTSVNNVYVHDSIPQPYPVERNFTRWEKFRLTYFNAILVALALLIALLLLKYKLKR